MTERQYERFYDRQGNRYETAKGDARLPGLRCNICGAALDMTFDWLSGERELRETRCPNCGTCKDRRFFFERDRF